MQIKLINKNFNCVWINFFVYLKEFELYISNFTFVGTLMFFFNCFW